MDDETESTAGQQDEVRCAECGTTFGEGQEREVTDDGTFCRPCFNNLTAQLQQVVAAQGQQINYPMAMMGGLAGGAAGVLVWWGFTVVTNIAFGLIAVVIGVAVGKGIVLLSGNKRHLNLQVMSVVISALGFVYASYLVNRTFINPSLVEQEDGFVLPVIPDFALLTEVVRLDFGIIDLVFLAIVAFQAWKIPAPVRIGSD